MKRRNGLKSPQNRIIERLEDRLLLSAVSETEPNDGFTTANIVPLTPNVLTTVSGSIDPLGDVDLYSVTLAAGDTLRADIDTPVAHALNSFLQIFDSSGSGHPISGGINDDDGSTTDSLLQIQIQTAGTYYIGVSDSSYSFYDPNNPDSTFGANFATSSGPYDLKLSVTPAIPEAEPDDILLSAMPVAVGSNGSAVVQGTVDPTGDVDLYKVHMGFGDTLTADLNTSNLGSSLIGYLRVFDSTGSEVTSNGGDAGGDPLATFTAHADGDYYVGVSDPSNSQYNPANSPSDPSDPDFRHGFSTGDYFLTLQVTSVVDAGDTLGTATFESLDANSGKTAPGIISAGDADLYQFTLSAGDTLDVNIEAQDLGALNSYLRIFDSSGQQLAINDNTAGGTTDSHLNFVASTAGTYYIGVSAADNTAYDVTTTGSGGGTGAGNYLATFTLSPLDGDDTFDTAHPVTFVRGQPANPFSGAIANGLDVDLYSFSLIAGDTLSVDTGSGDAPRLRVFNANGSQVATNASGSSLDGTLSFAVPTTGTYFVGASAASNSTYDPKIENSGSGESATTPYQLNFQVDAAAAVTAEVEPNNTIGTPNVVDPNSSLAGSIGSTGDVDYYMFTVTEAGQFSVDVTANAGSPLDSRVTLFGIDGKALGTSDDAAFGNLNPHLVEHLAPGSYFLKVEASPGVAAAARTGAYHLTTQFIGATSPFVGHPAGPFTSGIATGDFNGDGVMDLVTADRFGGSVSIQLGLGDLSYKPASTFFVGNEPMAVVTGDFNNDNILDLAVANSADGTVSILLGNGTDGHGDGTFQDQVTYAVGSTPLALVAADLNGDGITDLAVANSGDGTVSILIGQGTAGHGDGTFNPGDTLTVGDGPADIVAAKLTGSGRIDLVVANRQSNDVSVLINTGAGHFATQVRYAVGDQPTSLVAAKLNGDGILDLAVANAGSDDVSLLFGQAGGTFSSEVRTDIRDAAPTVAAGDFRAFVTAADFNGDGVQDLVVGLSTDFRVSVALGNGDGTFKHRQEFTTNVSGVPWAAVIADFNHDGRMDFAVADQGTFQTEVFGGLGDGTFASGARLNVGREARDLITADLNHDGKLDLVTANAVGASVLLGQGGGAFDDQLLADAGDPTAIAVGDVNGDGRLDIVASSIITDSNSSTTLSQVIVLLGLGDGTYQRGQVLDVAVLPLGITLGDFNNDQKLDIAVTSQQDSNLTVLLNNGDGTFTAQTPINVGFQPQTVATGDFNHDGVLDLAVANTGEGDVSILLGNVDANGHGDGTFATPATLQAGSQPTALAVADFNGDGVDDLAVGNSGDNSVTILVGAAASISDFPTTVATANASPLILQAGTGVRAIVAADFNGDGNIDLATANDSTEIPNAGSNIKGDVSVFLNRGSGTFDPQKPYSINSTLNPGSSPAAIVAGDFNGDGRLDLAVANSVSNNLAVLLGQGDGTFGPPNQSSSAGADTAPVLADFNGDKIPDSVVMDRAGNVILRLGRKDQLGTFAGPIIVNPGSPAAGFVAMKDGGQTLLGILDSGGSKIGLYKFNSAGLPSVVSQTDLSVHPGRSDLGTHFDRIIVASLNGDNRDDLVAIDSNRGTLNMFVRSGNGFDVQNGKAVAVQASPSDLLAANLDGTGGVDFLVADQSSGSVDVLLGGFNAFAGSSFRSSSGVTGVDQPGGPGTAVSPLVFDGTSVFTVGDFNEDGAADAIVAHRGTNTISLLAGKGNGGFANAVDTPAGSRPIAIAAGDFNGDKHLDLAVLNDGTHDVSIFRGDGLGHFTLIGSYDAGNSPTGLTVADVNGDNKLDLVVSNTLGDITVLPGNGDGTFKPFTRIDRSMAISVGDLDGDGKPDWVVTNQTSDRVVVQHETQSSGLVQGRTDGVTAPAGAKIADIDGDGIQDMVVANSGSNSVLVYRGLGGGQFEAARSFFAGTDPVDVQVGDVNGDGINDVVVTNFGSNDVSILLGSHDVNHLLLPGVRLNVGQGPMNTQLVDTNGDGKIDDLLVTNSVSNNVMMLPALGAGFFNDVNPTIFDTGRTPTQTLVGNFSGQQGFVTINRDSNSLTFYSSFNSAFRRDLASGGSSPLTAIAADFNKDGMSDIVVGNNGNGVFSLFEGGQTGLTLANSFFDNSIDHPAALAVADFGQGKELQLLALDEGDELVHTFGRDTVTAGDVNLGSQLFALASQSLGNATGLGSTGFSFAFNAALALGVSVQGVLQQSIDSSFVEGGGTDTSKKFSLEFFDDLSSVIQDGQRLIASAWQGLESVTGIDIDDAKLTKALEEVVEIVFPHVPWKALPSIIHNVLGSMNPKNSSAPFAIDQALEDFEVERWIDSVATDVSDAIGNVPGVNASIAAVDGAAKAIRRAVKAANPWMIPPDKGSPAGAISGMQGAVDRVATVVKRFFTGDEAPAAANGAARASLAAPLGAFSWSAAAKKLKKKPNPIEARVPLDDRRAAQFDHRNREAWALAAVMGTIGVGGWAVRSRRRRENLQPGELVAQS